MDHRRHFIRTTVLAASLAALLTPSTASADLRATGFVGASRINDTNKGTFGGAVTLGSLIGVEFDASRISLGSLDNVNVPGVDVEANITTYMGNLVVRAPTGRLQPYGSAGIGVARATGSVRVPFLGNVISASAADAAWNVGGGLYLFPSENLGIRADLRHFQTGDVTWEEIANIGDLPLPKFDFWRATVGLTFKF